MQFPPHTAIPASRAIVASRSVSGATPTRGSSYPLAKITALARAGVRREAELVLEQRVRDREDHQVDGSPISAIEPTLARPSTSSYFGLTG